MSPDSLAIHAPTLGFLKEKKKKPSWKKWLMLLCRWVSKVGKGEETRRVVTQVTQTSLPFPGKSAKQCSERMTGIWAAGFHLLMTGWSAPNSPHWINRWQGDLQDCHSQDRQLTSGLTVKNAFGSLQRENQRKQLSVRGRRWPQIYLKLCWLTYVSDSFPFPLPSSFHWDNLGHTFGLKYKSNS